MPVAMYLKQCAIAVALTAIISVSELKALEMRLVESDLGPFGETASIYMNGEIESGDAEKLGRILGKLDQPAGSRVNILFNSPGGSLVEALEVGRVINAIPSTVTTDVKSEDGPASCASACVVAYLGGHYRFLAPGSTLGIHQFSFGEGSEINGNEATAVSQLLSGEVVKYIREMRADPELFSLMTRYFPNEIHWLTRPQLEKLNVVTGVVFDERNEYKNAEGFYYLLIWQQSYHGENKIAVMCRDEKAAFIAFLQPPDLEIVRTLQHDFAVMIDGSMEKAAVWNIAGIGPRFVKVGFSLTAGQINRLATARNFGARMIPPSGDIFFGFEADVSGGKLRKAIRGCDASTVPVPGPGMTVLPETDLPGGDISEDGVKGLSFQACRNLCRGNGQCVAVSWIASKQWCWPKSSIEGQRDASGLKSAIKE